MRCLGEDNFIGLIWFRKKTMPLGATYLERMGDYIVWLRILINLNTDSGRT
jgi:hypothetical protein